MQPFDSSTPTSAPGDELEEDSTPGEEGEEEEETANCRIKEGMPSCSRNYGSVGDSGCGTNLSKSARRL